MLSLVFLLIFLSTGLVSSVPVCQPSNACQKINNNTLRCSNLTNSQSVFIVHCPNDQIEFLDLSGNNISKVVETHEQADTSQTEIKDGKSEWQEVKINTQFLKNLKRMDLSHNQFRSFPSELLNSQNLKILDLSFNKINKINNTLKMNALTSLNLQNNALEKLHDDSFESYSNLQELDLSGNKLTILKDLKLKNIRVLNVSNNQISQIEENTFKESTHLEILDLSNNLLTQITQSIFKGVQSSLRRLDLSNNKLIKVFSDAFSELEQLHNLSLSQNPELKNIDHIIFPYHLELLELNNISLQDVNDCTFQHLKDIRRLNLGGNELSCSCHIYRIFMSFGSTLYINENTTCKNLTNNLNLPIKSLNLKCSTHNCRSHNKEKKLPPSLNITISVVDMTIQIKWRSSLDTQQFLLQINDSSNLPVVSKYIDFDREYEFESSSSFAQYVACVSAVNEEKEILQQACEKVYISDKNFIIGISAGLIGLLPCAVLLIYIVCKDKKYKMKLLTEAPEDTEPIVKEKVNTNGVKQENYNNAFEHEDTEKVPKTIPQADLAASDDQQNTKSQPSSTHL